MHDRAYAGLGLLACGLGLPAAFALETATRPAGTDGDNAAQSLVYLQQHGTAYQLSGLCLVVAALGLLRAATTVPWRTAFLTAVGCVAAGLWVFAGALRVSAPGPVDHIRGYDEQWGEAAYLVVQMAGTQGGLLGGVVLTAFWVVTGCVVAWRGGTLPRPLCALGLVALVYPLGSVLSLLVDLGDALWFAGLLSLVVGVPGWLVVTGAWATATGVRSRNQTSSVSTTAPTGSA